MIKLRLEILYADNSVEIINPTIISELTAIRKTGVLAMVFWQDEDGKRIPYGYRDGKDNYVVIVDTNLFFIIFDAWNDGDRIVINAKKQTTRTSRVSLRGKVITINRPYDFIVIDLGRRDGIQMGDMLKVHHDREVIGVVRVERVYETLSAAAILNDDVRLKVTETDTVTPVSG